MTGLDYCGSCESETPFALVGRRATPEQLVGTALEGKSEVGTVAWECLRCGARGERSMERFLVHLAALGLDPQPAGAA